MKDVPLRDLQDGMSGRFGIAAVTGAPRASGVRFAKLSRPTGRRRSNTAEAVAQSIGGRAFAVD
jgi:hypothetical protein